MSLQLLGVFYPPGGGAETGPHLFRGHLAGKHHLMAREEQAAGEADWIAAGLPVEGAGEPMIPKYLSDVPRAGGEEDIQEARPKPRKG